MYSVGFNQGQATMVACPWIFLKTHVIKISSTLQGQMEFSTIESKGCKCGNEI
jgi:hypothetical protein